MTVSERAVRIFGLTDDPFEAGYILEDGSMLDFSGRRLGNAPSGHRSEDHRAICEAWPRRQFDSTTDAMTAFMAEEGAVRVSCHSRGPAGHDVNLDFIYYVTPAQERTIRQLLRGAENLSMDRVNEDRRKRDSSCITFSAPCFDWFEIRAFLRGAEI